MPPHIETLLGGIWVQVDETEHNPEDTQSEGFRKATFVLKDAKQAGLRAKEVGDSLGESCKHRKHRRYSK